MDEYNPFKLLEPDVPCPPELKKQLVSEIDFIRNVIVVIDLYVGDLFGVASVLGNASQEQSDDKKNLYETTS